MSSFSVILLAAGKSSRFKDKEKKPYTNLDGRAVWLHSLERFTIREDVIQLLIVIDSEDREMFERRYRANVAFVTNAKVIDGGPERADSVMNALAFCDPKAEFIAVHDTARPCVTREMIEAVFDRALKTGAAVLAHPVHDTLKRADNDKKILETIPRSGLWLTQTPQVFRRQLLLDAYARREKGKSVTDDAQLVEALGEKISLVESDASNIKITTKQDLLLAAAIRKGRPKPKDKRSFHPFAEDDMWK